MFWLVVQEFWRRHKPVVTTALFTIAVLVLLHVTGLIWTLETWARSQLNIARMNPIVLFTLLIGIGLTIDHARNNTRQ